MIKVYSIPNCPYCAELKEILIKEGLEFVDVNIMLQENEKEYNELYNLILEQLKVECDDVPIVRVGKQILVPNHSFRSIREAADLTKKFLG